MDNEKNLNILLRFALDGQALTRVKSGVSSLESELDKANQKALATQQAMMDLADASQRASRGFTKIFAAGTAITGGIFAAAQRYVANAKDATTTTKEWMNQTKLLEQSQSRVGEVLAREALPTLKKATELAGKAATFVEKNPEIVRAALNIGMVVAGLGAVGMAVTKGIKLYADMKMAAVAAQQLLAGRLMEEAANKQAAAAAMAAGDIRGAFGIGPGSGAGLMGAAGMPVKNIIAIVLAELGLQVGYAKLAGVASDKISKSTGIDEGKVQKTLDTLMTVLTAGIYPLGKALLKLVDKPATPQKNLGVSATANMSSLAVVTDAQKGVVDSYVKMLEQEKQATQQYAVERAQIVQSANDAVQESNKRHYKTYGDIVRNYDKTVASITESFRKSQVDAEKNYAQQRAQTIRSAGVEIQRIEEDHQENLRKLLLEHNDRVDGLVSARDALGLVREMRDYERRRKEEEESTNKQISRRKEDVATTLRDMAQQFAQERAARLADYKERLKEAATQKAEAIKAEAQRWREEQEQIAKQRQQALQDLNRQYQLERQRRQEAFVAQVRDLDTAMANEQKRRQQYYMAMLNDVNQFMAAYRKSLPSGSTSTGSGTLPIRDSGGYATKGVYGLAQDGRTEFVLSGASTRAAEMLIGTRLTQENLMAALRQGSGRSVTWNDNRRFDSRLTSADRRAIQQDTLETIAGAFA